MHGRIEKYEYIKYFGRKDWRKQPIRKNWA